MSANLKNENLAKLDFPLASIFMRSHFRNLLIGNLSIMNEKFLASAILIVSTLIVPTSFVSASVLANESDVVNQGLEAFNQGRFQDAENYFLKRVDNPEHKNESLIYLSRIALGKENSEAAMDYIERSLRVEPNNVEEIIFAGDVYCNHAQKSSMFKALKMAKKCVAQYDAAVTLAPDNIDAVNAAMRFHLGAPAIAGGSAEQGNQLLERLKTLSPEDATSYQIQLLDRDGDVEKALALADELVKKQFRSAKNQYEIAHFYRDKKLYQKSKPLFESLMRLAKNPKNMWYVNDSLLQLGEIFLIEKTDLNRSVELLEEYKKHNTNPLDMHYFWSTWSLAKAYKAVGKKDQYDALVEKIKSEDYEKNKAFAKEFEAAIKTS